MGRRCSDYEDDVGSLVKEVLVLTGQLNLADFIWFCKNLDLQRFEKRLKDVKVRFDTMMDKIIERHQEAKKLRKMDTTLADSTMENLKAFVLVKSSWIRFSKLLFSFPCG